MKGQLYLGAAVLASAASAAQAEVPKDFRAQADKIVAEAWKADAPGAVVIVTEGGRTVYAAGRGLADLETKTPITPDTVFRIGSITKQFPAAVMLQLVDEGKVALDDPLSKYLPDYPQPGASATVRQLLNHSSGIASYTGIPGWMVEANTNKPYTTEQMIDQFKALPPPSRPGEAWAYNNSGYVLVGAIIEKVTGKPWHQAVNERIAAPLKLSTLRYGIEEDRIPNMAKGYSWVGEDRFEPAPKIHMSVPHAAGGLIGTVGDLAIWTNALHHGRVLTPQAYQGMITPARLKDKGEHPYGFGLQLEEIRGHRAVGHGGGIFGFATASTFLPDKDVFVAVFANAIPPVTSPDAVASRLAALAIGDAYPDFEKQVVDVKSLDSWFGRYRIGDGNTERIFYTDDGKLFTRRDGPPLEVFAAGNNRFFYEDRMTWFELKQSPAGAIMEMHAADKKRPEQATRVGPVPPEAEPADVPRETLQRYVGSYVVGGPIAVVTLGDEGLSIKLGEQPRLRLIPRSQTEFEVDKAGARVRFNAEPGAAAKSMGIQQGGRSTEAMRVKE